MRGGAVIEDGRLVEKWTGERSAELSPASASCSAPRPPGCTASPTSSGAIRDNRDVLVCVHGLTRCARDFDDLARALCDHYRVVCPDVAGRGDSDWLADPMLYSCRSTSPTW